MTEEVWSSPIGDLRIIRVKIAGVAAYTDMARDFLISHDAHIVGFDDLSGAEEV